MSIMLNPEEVDDGYFTPVASTTLANIFKDDSSNDAAVNPSLKYRPLQIKKSEENTSKADDADVSQCVFSCSVIAYEWVQGSHMSKGKVGFAMMQTVKSGLCKIILYSPDKSTLSCTTLMQQLEVTLKGAMISLYDDRKKYWGLCFNNKTIGQVKQLLKKEKVIIKHYVNPEFIKPDVENLDSDETTDETDSSSLAEDGAVTSRNTKASILNRIANVGQAILPTLPGSPVKKQTPLNIPNITDIFDSPDKLNVLPDSSVKSNHDNTRMQDQEPTKSIAIQTGINNAEANNILKSNTIQSAQTSVTSLPLVNNQIFTYVNGYMVPLHMQVPVIENINCPDTCAEIDMIIHKLNLLKGSVRIMETKHSQNEEKIQTCICKAQEQVKYSTAINEEVQTDLGLKDISDLEHAIRERGEIINNKHQKINNLCEQIENIKQDLNMKDEKIIQMIPKTEADIFLASTVKTLMNNTFRSLASNFDNDISYTGNSIKGILAAVIKKNTVESLSTLLSNQDNQPIS